MDIICYLIYLHHVNLFDFRPINNLNEIDKSPVKRKSEGFRFPEESVSQFPAPSPFNYGDRVIKRRKGLSTTDENG